MKRKFLIPIFSLIITILITLVCWWIWDCPKLQSNVDMFLLGLIEITLYNTLEVQLTRIKE